MLRAPDRNKYRRALAQDEPRGAVVVRMRAEGKVAAYVDDATRLLREPAARVTVVGAGGAINKAVTVAEMLRRERPELHQVTGLHSTDVTERYEPLEEGLEVVEVKRVVSCIDIQLFAPESPDLAKIDRGAPGYAGPRERR